VKRALLILVAALAVSAAPAAAGPFKRGPCVKGGPKCYFWKAKVTRFADGDTIGADIAGDGTHKEFRVRFVNIQAMELHRYSNKYPSRRRGECHGVEATARLEKILKQAHRHIQLAAQHTWSMAGKKRLRRYVLVKRHGHWQDVGQMMIREGHALWMADTIEWARNSQYNLAQEQAEREGKNLWNPTTCGKGPFQDVPIKLWVNWDPAGKDTDHRNEEFVKVQNRSRSTALPLRHWWIRDAQHRQYTIRKNVVIQPGHTLTLRAGHGTDTTGTLFWGLDENPFQNPGDFHHMGDGGYLFDPKGDLRAHMTYPCRVACKDPNQGAIRVVAQPAGDEYATFTNVSNHDIDFYGNYAMTTKGSAYPFPEGSLLHPGETMRVDVDGSPRNDTRLHKHWGRTGNNLPNGGGWVHLETFTAIRVGCDSWGGGRC
jgi:endonuclease YncB( thermonuclease family)